MKIEELLENFELFDDWEDRYQYLIELGKQLPHMPDKLKNDTNKVEGCTSQVWIVAKIDDDNKFDFIADSDSHIVKGLIAILRCIFANKDMNEIAKYNIDEIFSLLGLQQHLSVNRRNGFYAMVEKLQNYINKYKNAGHIVLK